MGDIRVGVAGFDYKDWRGQVYPEPRPRGFDRLRYLAEYLDVVEINSSFYGPPKPATAERWVERVAERPRFRFAAKLWRRFTHERGSAWTRAEVREARAGFAPLLEAARLSAVLVQFPMSFKHDGANREWLEDVVETFQDLPLVLEVRHASWNEAGFYGWLADHGVGFVNIDQPLFHECLKPSARATARIGYVRVHGRNYRDWFRRDAGRDARYDYLYTPERLRHWVERTREVAAEPGTESVDVVFNNHYKAQAVVNAIQFDAMLAGRPVPAPPPLLAAYPDALRSYATAQPATDLRRAG